MATKFGEQPVRIENLAVSAYEIPTETPESDGTLKWNATTLVVVEVTAGDQTGLGYTYADQATAALIKKKLAEIVPGRRDPLRAKAGPPYGIFLRPRAYRADAF